jgi:putative lysine transport system permease protein
MPSNFFEGVWFLIVNYWPLFLYGVLTTLIISLFGTILGFFIGLLLSVLRITKVKRKDSLLIKISKKIGSIFGTSYVQFFRGTPMMVQATLIYYGFLRLGGHWSAFVAGIFIVGLNTAAYIAEIVRSGINAIDVGQNEAARSLGMTHFQAMRYVVLPQAIKNVIPAIGNEFIVNVKDTSVLSVIAVTDLFYNSKSITLIYYRYFEVYFITSMIYLIITLVSSKLLSLLDKKLGGISVYSFPTSQTVPEAFIGGDNDNG